MPEHLPNFDDVLRANPGAILDRTADGVVVVDRRARIVFFSPSAEELFGWSRDQILGLPVHVLIPMDKAIAHAHHVEGFFGPDGSSRLMDGGRHLEAQHKDGRRIPVEIAISTVGDDASFAIAHVRDITERVAAAEALAASQHQIGAFLRYSASPLIVLNRDRSVKFANPAYCEAVGYTLDQVQHRPAELLHPDDLEKIQTALATDGARNGVARVEVRALHADGSWRWLDASIRSLLGGASDRWHRRELPRRQRAAGIDTSIGRTTSVVRRAGRACPRCHRGLHH